MLVRRGPSAAEDRNRVVTMGDRTRHPEFELARWAATNITAEQRAAATVYTSGEHCPMCAAAHGWVGLGRIVYVVVVRAARRAGSPSSASQPGVVRALPAQEVAPGVVVEGPVAELEDEVHELHCRFYGNRSA